MSMRRSPALVAGILVLASTLSMAGTAAAVPGSQPTSSYKPAVTKPAVSKPAIGVRAVAGQPPRNYVIPNGPRFAFPNRTKAEKLAIRNAVLLTIQSTWGGVRDRYRLAMSTSGKIRIATWSFKDMGIAKALVAAHRRGVSVQVIAAKGRNRENKPWRYLKRQLGQSYYKPGVAGSTERISFARECKGSCRGPGGTPHSKFFLFDNVGASHVRHVVSHSSMNLTNFGYQGQWNFAQTVRSADVFDRFMRVYREMRLNRPNSAPYRVYPTGDITSIFFPRPGANSGNDPVMQLLNQVQCLGATNGSGRTRIRIINYSIYDTRGTWIAKKLKALYNAGCDVKIIYSLTTRPVLAIMRNGSGRGAIPIRQSIILNKSREIVKYNHSKWMTINGRLGLETNAWVTLAGSSNWSNIGFTSDEQMMQVTGYGTVRAFNANFDKTWAQKTSRAPTFAPVAEQRGLPSEQPAFGRGQLKYMNPYGD
jgi:phosphatidylserine/phosphatidylglycerophosphate/cardiolipin synthase-like enzyme